MDGADRPEQSATQEGPWREPDYGMNKVSLKAPSAPIANAVMNYEKLAEELATALDSLEAKLNPILSEGRDEAEPHSVPTQSGTSKTANSLNGLNSRLGGAIRRIRRMTQEVEV